MKRGATLEDEGLQIIFCEWHGPFITPLYECPACWPTFEIKVGEAECPRCHRWVPLMAETDEWEDEPGKDADGAPLHIPTRSLGPATGCHHGFLLVDDGMGNSFYFRPRDSSAKTKPEPATAPPRPAITLEAFA